MADTLTEKSLIKKGISFIIAINLIVVLSIFVLITLLFGFSGEEYSLFMSTFLLVVVVFEVLGIVVVTWMFKPVRQLFKLKEAGEELPEELIEEVWLLFTKSPFRGAVLGFIAPSVLSTVIAGILKLLDAITTQQTLYGIGLGLWAGLFLSISAYTFFKNIWEDVADSIPQLSKMGWGGPKLGMSFKLMLFGIALTAMPAILIGMISFQQSSMALEKAANEHMKQEARLLASTVKWALDMGQDEMILENLIENSVRTGVPIFAQYSSRTPILGNLSGISDSAFNALESGEIAVATSEEHLVALSKIEGHDYIVGISASRSRLKKELQHIRVIIGFITLAAFILAAVLAVFFARGFTVPLRKMLSRLEVFGKGGLTHIVSIPSDDEIDDLNIGFERMAGNLSEMVLSIGEASKSVMNATDQIASSMAKLAEGSRKQMDATGKTLSSMEAVDRGAKLIQDSLQNLVSSTADGSASILEMTSSIQEIVQMTDDLTGSIGGASSSVQQMTQSIKRVAESVESLSDATEESASSMIEMDATIREVAKRASETINIVQKVNEDAQAGAEAVSTTIKGIEGIKYSFGQVEEVIENLVIKSAEIDKILGVINHVAEETNLLALNAAILAAQAGDSGRGFSVVAGEIKALAERTGRSTKEIAEVIKGLKNEANAARGAMDTGVHSVQQTVELSQKAGAALQQIQSSAVEASNMIQGIGRITKEQAQGSITVTKSVARVSDMAMQINVSMKEQADGSDQVKEATEKMIDISSMLKNTTVEQSKGMGRISASIEDIKQRAEDIANTQNEQKEGEDIVLEATHNIKDIAEDCMNSVESVESALAKLASQSENLEKAMGRFKVS